MQEEWWPVPSRPAGVSPGLQEANSRWRLCTWRCCTLPSSLVASSAKLVTHLAELSNHHQVINPSRASLYFIKCVIFLCFFTDVTLTYKLMLRNCWCYLKNEEGVLWFLKFFQGVYDAWEMGVYLCFRWLKLLEVSWLNGLLLYFYIVILWSRAIRIMINVIFKIKCRNNEVIFQKCKLPKR